MKRLRLIQLNERELGSIHYLTKPVVSIGRASHNDIIINHKQVSREHLIIRVAKDGVSATVEDCGSANGAFLNGDAIEHPTTLLEGSVLTIGDIDFRVELLEPESIAGQRTVESSQYETHRTAGVDDFNSEQAVSAHRNAEIDALGLRNLDQDDTLDEIAQVAATIFGVSKGFVSVVGEESCYYRGAFGLEQREWNRSETPCLLVVEAHAPIWAGDLFADPKLLSLPFLKQPPTYHFYAAAPYCGPTGLVVGTVGVVCETPRSASESQLEALSNLAKFVERHINLQLEKRRADQLHLKLVDSKASEEETK